MIADHEKLISAIVSWLVDYAKQNGKTYFMYESAPNLELIGLLCKRQTAINNFPISFTLESNTTGSIVIPKLDRPINPKAFEEYCQVYKMAVMSAMAAHFNGLIIGYLTREEKHSRQYYKRGNGNADLYPLADLFSDETIDLYGYLTNQCFACYPSDNQWADKENQKFKIIESDDSPTKHNNWPIYTMKQKEVISKLHFVEKVTRHKALTAPILRLRDNTALVR